MSNPTTGTDATIDALKDETGAIPNGRMKTPERKKYTKKVERNGEVKQARAPIEPWECDECMQRGKNLAQLQEHVEESRHTLFTRL